MLSRHRAPVAFIVVIVIGLVLGGVITGIVEGVRRAKPTASAHANDESEPSGGGDKKVVIITTTIAAAVLAAGVTIGIIFWKSRRDAAAEAKSQAPAKSVQSVDDVLASYTKRLNA